MSGMTTVVNLLSRDLFGLCVAVLESPWAVAARTQFLRVDGVLDGVSWVPLAFSLCWITKVGLEHRVEFRIVI